MKTLTWSARGLAVMACCAGLCWGCHERKPAGIVPGQVVRMDSEVLEEFYEEIEDYVKLRQSAVAVVPPLPEGATADQIAIRQRALTKAIVDYRRRAKRGEIFKPEIETAFRRVFKECFEGPQGPAIMQEIKSGNPKVEGVPKPGNPTQEARKPVPLAVNAVYPDDAPFSSVPPTLLLKIPVLPDQVRYRFVGRALIVRDTEANVILDFIPDVVPDRTIPR